MGIVLTALAFVFFLYTGLRLDDPASLSTIRQSVAENFLSQSTPLLISCTVLACLLVIVLGLGFASETAVFLPNTESDVRVLNEKRKFLGVASSSNPLRKRLFSGTRSLEFAAEGFDPVTKEVRVSTDMLSGREKRVAVALRATPHFVLSGFSAYGASDRVFYEPHDGLRYPDYVSELPFKTMGFTLSSASPVPLMIEKIYVRVVEARPLPSESTFPHFPIGAGGMGPYIPGFVRLRPEIGLYEARTRERVWLGGSDVTENSSYFNIYTFCEPGYLYRVQLHIEWRDMQVPERGGSYSFDDELELNFPNEVVRWEDLVRPSQHVKFVLDNVSVSAPSLISILSSWERPPDYTILVPTRSSEWMDKQNKEAASTLKRVAVVPESEYEPVVKVVGKHFIHGQEFPREFAIIDRNTLLLRYDESPGRAEIIVDEERVTSVEEAYDDVVERLSEQL